MPTDSRRLQFPCPHVRQAYRSRKGSFEEPPPPHPPPLLLSSDLLTFPKFTCSFHSLAMCVTHHPARLKRLKCRHTGWPQPAGPFVWRACADVGEVIHLAATRKHSKDINSHLSPLLQGDLGLASLAHCHIISGFLAGVLLSPLARLLLSACVQGARAMKIDPMQP